MEVCRLKTDIGLICLLLKTVLLILSLLNVKLLVQLRDDDIIIRVGLYRLLTFALWKYFSLDEAIWVRLFIAAGHAMQYSSVIAFM